MNRGFNAILVSAAMVALVAGVHAQAQEMPKQQLDMKSAFVNADFASLPGMPEGKSTVLGGQIRDIDPVLDQFKLDIFGQHPMKILFDERTQVFRNGSKISVRELKPGEHASVQTTLEGSKVFAISIHMLSELPQGECQGRVLGFDRGSRELTIGSSLSREPIRLLVSENTPVVREGQTAFRSESAGQADLVNGALVSATFDADAKGRAVASRITVLAKPGAEFVFSGKISSLDMHNGVMVVVDPRDQKRYEISFDPSQSRTVESLHVGDAVRISANFDGNRYQAVNVAKSQIGQE